ncbi:bifunctional adenosylcobinamide kinase/adenosylcobinamide-phosphate guanylyltransferase [Shewanella ulleungensis]|uniref:Bifunctional adenosylcobalamin biosynthesis protein n=1 Tax=Shewanella ulleungensis TaxID=2282699 RepID=A0ABQ2QNH8_9GAMM|nr:bifunctional adenosylcobinamide kinase/adenosylcobinamide-phosphate guanylyltransferase [Shewanella ulleungensis]MCL1150060.1 bifunctional adenosylcobinamide kinase/adenosylcobinamide-phosphate guanylyltransferase [Shewanella ulleungensis]GGP86446.1 bifunctional adenosylcobinamide kinase/adenosylcobinamide-phosphate guanylyltransferase [Shewanella ulleungensis]
MIHLVLGGARSGKSRFAEQRVTEYAAIGYSCVYVATATALDQEMAQRIAKHQQDRVSSVHSWTLHEQAFDVAQTLTAIDKPQQVILVDCLTLLLTNHLLDPNPTRWPKQKTSLLECLTQLRSDVVLVSNEVGSGIVPMGELNRQFVDEAGWLNQAIANIADQVTLVVAGLPLALKQ